MSAPAAARSPSSGCAPPATPRRSASTATPAGWRSRGATPWRWARRGWNWSRARRRTRCPAWPRPDAVFVGGGLSAGTLDACLGALQEGGRLVANAVTLESEAVLLDAHARHGGQLVRLSVQRAEPVGGLHGWRPLMPVTQWALVR